MDQLIILLLLLLVVAAVVSAIILPIIALIIALRSRKKISEEVSRLRAAQPSPTPGEISPHVSDSGLLAAIGQLNTRVENLEAALTAHSIRIPDAGNDRTPTQPELTATEPSVPSAAAAALVETAASRHYVPSPDLAELRPSVTRVPSSTVGVGTVHAEQIESIIGRRWLGWAAVALILFAAAFFLKYAFDNRWIGELGRVASGVGAGVIMVVLGFKYYRYRWRIFSQILTAGGIVLLYLSAYAAFGYYHLATQKTAFVYLALLVAEAAGLAYLYDAPAIAIMALVGGFLAPILLRSDRDQYRSLFGYIAALDIGALALLKHWTGLSSLAFTGTHLLFWLWYDSNYHPRKLGAVMFFQFAVFLVFLLAHVGRQLVGRQSATLEDLGLLLINPFVFFATAYHLLNANHHEWMGVFAIGMALLYAGSTKILLSRSATNRSEALSMIAVALTFVTIATPIQLQSNCITIAWAVEALVMFWAGLEIRSQRLRALAYTLFGLALVRLVFWDTPGVSRPIFMPVFNKYFLSSLVVTGCLFTASALYRRPSAEKRFTSKSQLALLLVAITILWFVMSVETYTFFAARAAAQKLAEDADHERWLGQMGLSVMWSIFAGTLAAAGFVRRSAAVRWASLGLFTLTVIKAMLVDIAQLQQLYRVIVFCVLGVLLLVVAWGYHKAFHSRESAK